jgi:predicted small metal-binding protein
MDERKNPTSTRPGGEGVADANTADARNATTASGTKGGYAGDYSFRCGDVMNGCDWQTHAGDESELRRNIEQHGREHHGIKDMGEDTWNKVKGFIRRKAA